MSRRPDSESTRGAEVSPGYVIPQLTFLRFPAIVWIALFHFGVSGTSFFRTFAGHGYLAVTFFFVLSGFTLAARYAGRRIEPTRFMLARLARIYPLYLVGLAVCGVIFAYFGTLQRNLPALPLNVLLIQAWVPSFALTWNKPCWFLSVLSLFYLVFCLSFDRVSRMTPKTMAFSLTGIWLASVAALVLLKSTVYTGEPSASHDLIFYHPIMHLNSFLIGVGGGLAFRGNVFQRMAGGRPGWVVAAGALAALLGIVAVDDFGYVLHDGLLAPLFLALIVGVALDASMVARAFSSRACVALGNLAFAMYILQLPVKAVFLAGVSRFDGRGMSASWMSYLVVLLLVSAVAFVLIERPSHRALVGGRSKSA